MRNAYKIANIVEHFTRRLVDVEEDRDMWKTQAEEETKAANKAVCRAKKAEDELSAAHARIAELEGHLAFIQGAGKAQEASPDTCPHSEGTCDWAQWWMERGKVLICDESSGIPMTYRMHNGVMQLRAGGHWNKSSYNSALDVPYPGWRILPDAEVAALEGE